jgi:transposase
LVSKIGKLWGVEAGTEPSYEEVRLLLAAKDAAIAQLTSLVEQLSSQCEQLAARVDQLERQRDRDSSNSSKPPSSDLPFSKPAPKRSSRTSSGRKRGKQDGAPGVTLRLVEDPDQIVRHEPRACGGCGAHLGDAPVFDERRHQVFDTPAPPPRPHVTEHRIVAKTCAGCGTTTVGDIPAWAQGRVQYGPGIAARAAWLVCAHHLPVRRAAASWRRCSARRCPPGSSPRCASARPVCWRQRSCRGCGS